MYQPPKSAQKAAQQVIEWKRKYPNEIKGMTRVGWTRARQLASGEKISADVLKRMAQFNRHRSNYRKAMRKNSATPWREPAIVAWRGWGGTGGIDWARRESAKLTREKNPIMYILEKKVGKRWTAVTGKFQFGDKQHARKRGDKHAGKKVFWGTVIHGIEYGYLAADKPPTYRIRKAKSNPMRKKKVSGDRWAIIGGELYQVMFLGNGWHVVREDDGVGHSVFNAGKGDGGKKAAIAHLHSMKENPCPPAKKARKKNPISQGMQLPGGKGRVLSYDNATKTVLVDRGSGVEPFVVWTIDPETYETFWGHYYKNLGDAVNKFEEKAGLKMNPREFYLMNTATGQFFYRGKPSMVFKKGYPTAAAARAARRRLMKTAPKSWQANKIIIGVTTVSDHYLSENPRKKNPETEIRELALYADNLGPSSRGVEADIYRLRKKFGTRYQAGANKSELQQIAGRAAQKAAQAYNIVHGSGTGYGWREIFTTADVRKVKDYLYDSWSEEYGYTGNPKKRKKKKRRKNPSKKYLVVKVKGNDVRFLTASSATGKPRWTLTRGEAIRNTKRQDALHNALVASDYKTVGKDWLLSVIDSRTRTADIANAVNAEKLGKARRRRNPVGPTQRQVDRAVNLFKDFTGDHPEQMKSVRLPVPKTGLVIGELDGVLYTTVRDGKKESYVHDFKKGSRPLLASSHDGESLHILGGEYEFTERGIEDR